MNRIKSESTVIESILDSVKEVGTEYLHRIEKIPTTINFPLDIYKQDLKFEGSGTLEALKIWKKHYEPLMISSAGPRYWGFVTGGSTPAAIAGDWLTSIYDQNTQNKRGNGDISAVIEQKTIEMMLKLLGLTEDYFGGFVTGATLSNFTCLAVARQWAGKKVGRDVAKDGSFNGTKVLAATPHSSIYKSMSMLGIGSRNLVQIKSNDDHESIDLNDLEEKLKFYKSDPVVLCSSGGTVNTVDFDDMKGISMLKEKYDFWWHIDAAFGGYAACVDEYKHLLQGWENADSITIDNHKWLNIPYDNALFFVKKSHSVSQIESFQNSSAPYLGDPMTDFNYLNFLPENSRRFRALPVWFTLTAYGSMGIKEMIESSIAMANKFGGMISSSKHFELLAPVNLNVVCFTLKGEDDADIYLNKLNSTGKVFMTPTVYKNRKAIRAAFVNWRTTEKDLHLVFEEMNKLI